MSAPPLLQVKGLSKTFAVKAGSFGAGGRQLRAVHDVSFNLERGKTLGLVGESGCGKSTTGRLVLRLIEPTAGSVQLGGQELTTLQHSQLKPLRRRMQMVFQDPLGSLNPRHSIRQILTEPLVVHGIPRREHAARVDELLRDVELPSEAATRYPHEFSGGQRQRVAIARALALRPELVVADEPVSALDASIQSQILMLLKRLQAEHGIALLFISHDLGVVRYLCDDVAVMYFGEIVEYGPTEEVLGNPRHPYTQALLAAIPLAAVDAAPVEPLEGSIPDPTDPPPGCSFASRCKHAMPRCLEEAPPAFQIAPDHTARCWLNEAAGNESRQESQPQATGRPA